MVKRWVEALPFNLPCEQVKINSPKGKGDMTMSSNYDEEKAAKDTGVSIKEVKEAWHTAREQAQKAGQLDERKANKEGKK